MGPDEMKDGEPVSMGRGGGVAEDARPAADAASEDAWLHLLVGAGLEAGDELRRLGLGPRALLDRRVRHVLLGVLCEAYDGVATAAGVTTRLTREAFDWVRWLSSPIRGVVLPAPLRWPIERAAANGRDLVDRWERRGSEMASRSRRRARDAAATPIDRIVRHLQDDPEMRALVARQAASLLEELPPSPEVTLLVRTQADAYVEYLREHPGAVRDLISGQSVGLATEILNGLRYHTYRLDTVLERIARTILRRRPREELPPPSPEVRHRAAHPYDLWGA